MKVNSSTVSDMAMASITLMTKSISAPSKKAFMMAKGNSSKTVLSTLAPSRPASNMDMEQCKAGLITVDIGNSIDPTREKKMKYFKTYLKIKKKNKNKKNGNLLPHRKKTEYLYHNYPYPYFV